MKIQEIMTKSPRCVAPNDSVARAAQVMREIDVGAVPICEDGRLEGMITDRDIALRVVAEERQPGSTMVREVMSKGVVFVYEDQSVEEVAQVLEEKKIRRVPVLNREKKLVGILSLGDLAVDASTRLGGEALREISDPAKPRRSC